MEYVYPAIFSKNSDGSYTIIFPDLPGCISEGKSLANAIYMAQSALSQWIGYLSDKKEKIPNATEISEIKTKRGEVSTLVRAEIKDNKAVRRTVSVPKWLDEKASDAGLSLSRVLQDALQEKLS